MRSSLTVTVMFAVFLVAPALSLGLLGYPRMASEHIGWSDINWRQIDQVAYRKSVGRIPLINSPVGLRAVQARSWINYRLFHWIETPEVISGKSGWLFFKKQFWVGKCLPRQRIVSAMETMIHLHGEAAKAGIDLRFAVAPDKGVVHPEMLGYRASTVSGCKIRNAHRWRLIAREMNAPLIDHLEAFSNVHEQLYFATDSHWNNRAKALVVGQLERVYLGPNVQTPFRETGKGDVRRRDLMKMLRLRVPEANPDVVVEITPIQGKTLILHDSFYAVTADFLGRLFPDGRMFRINKPKSARAVASRPERILVESVERALINRLNTGDLSLNSAFAKELAKLNREPEAKSTHLSNAQPR